MNQINCSCLDCKIKQLFFELLDKKSLEEVCSIKTEKQFSKGEYIIKEGDKCSDFLYPKTGLLKLVKQNSNKDQILSIARPFDFVSLISIFSTTNYKYSIIALEETKICFINLDYIRNLAIENGKFALNIMCKLSEASDSIIDINLKIRAKNLKGRTAFVLLYFAEHIYNSTKYTLPITRREFAEFIGMTSENVIRTLSEFKKDEIILMNDKDIEITNLKRLKMIDQHG